MSIKELSSLLEYIKIPINKKILTALIEGEIKTIAPKYLSAFTSELGGVLGSGLVGSAETLLGPLGAALATVEGGRSVVNNVIDIVNSYTPFDAPIKQVSREELLFAAAGAPLAFFSEYSKPKVSDIIRPSQPYIPHIEEKYPLLDVPLDEPVIQIPRNIHRGEDRMPTLRQRNIHRGEEKIPIEEPIPRDGMASQPEEDEPLMGKDSQPREEPMPEEKVKDITRYPESKYPIPIPIPSQIPDRKDNPFKYNRNDSNNNDTTEDEDNKNYTLDNNVHIVDNTIPSVIPSIMIDNSGSQTRPYGRTPNISNTRITQNNVKLVRYGTALHNYSNNIYNTIF